MGVHVRLFFSESSLYGPFLLVHSFQMQRSCWLSGLSLERPNNTERNQTPYQRPCSFHRNSLVWALRQDTQRPFPAVSLSEWAEVRPTPSSRVSTEGCFLDPGAWIGGKLFSMIMSACAHLNSRGRETPF